MSDKTTLLSGIVLAGALTSVDSASAQNKQPPKDPNAPIENPKTQASNNGASDHRFDLITPSMMSKTDRHILSYTWKKLGLGYTNTRNGLLNPVLSADFETSRVMSMFYTEERFKDLHETKGGALWANALNIGAHTKIVTDNSFGASFSNSIVTPWFQRNQFAAVSWFPATTEFDFGVGAGFRLGPVIGRLEVDKVLGFFPARFNNNLATFNYIRDEVQLKFKCGALMSNDREMGLYAGFTVGQETYNPFAWFDPFDIGSKQKQGLMFGFNVGVQFGGLKAKNFKNIRIPKADDTSWDESSFTGNDAYYIFKMEAVPQDELAEVKGLENGATAIHFNDAIDMMHETRLQNMADMGIIVLSTPPITDQMGLELKSNGADLVVAQRPEIELRPGLTDQYGNAVSSDTEPSRLIIT